MATMNWILVIVLVAFGSCAKLDRVYLPPQLADSAGGSPEFLQTPLIKSTNEIPEEVPVGGFVNENQGVVVDAAAAGTRASEPQSGLGKPRPTYGSTDSKVGDAAFRDTNRLNQNVTGNQNVQMFPGNQQQNPQYHQQQPQFQTYQSNSQEPVQRTRDRFSNIVRYQNDVGIDRYSYGFESDNGIKVQASGVATNGVSAQGSYSYVGDDGKVYSVTYTANERGYQPQGDHIPTPPPIPTEILKALEQNAISEAAGIVDDGSYDAKKYNSEDHNQHNIDNKHNDRQTNKVDNRFGAQDNSAAFASNAAFNTANFIGNQNNINTNIRPQSNSNNYNTSPFGQGFNQVFPQTTHNQINSEYFISQKDPQKNSNSNTVFSNIAPIPNESSNMKPVFPLSQQNLQEQNNVDTSNTLTNNRPTSYDIPLSGTNSAQTQSGSLGSSVIGQYNQPGVFTAQNHQSELLSKPSLTNTQSSLFNSQTRPDYNTFDYHGNPASNNELQKHQQSTSFNSNSANSQFPSNANSITNSNSQSNYYSSGSVGTQNLNNYSPNSYFSQSFSTSTPSSNTFNNFAQNQAFTGTNSISKLPTIPPSQTLLTPKEDKLSYNKTPVSGLTQASISPFPSGSPTSVHFPQTINRFSSTSSNQATFEPNSQSNLINSFNTAQSQTTFFDLGQNKPSEISQSALKPNQGEIYEYNKPPTPFPATTSSIGQFQSPNTEQNNQYHQPLNTQSNTQNHFISQFNINSVENPTTPFFRPKPLPSRPSESELDCCGGVGTGKNPSGNNVAKNPTLQNEYNGLVPSLPFQVSNKGEEFSEAHKSTKFDSSGYHYK